MGFLINPFIYATGGGGCSGDIIDTTGLFAYYKFDSDATDETGTYDATSTTNATYTSDSKYGEAWEGANDGSTVRLATLPTSMAPAFNAPYDGGANGWTISVWVKTTSTITNFINIFTFAVRTNYSSPFNELEFYFSNAPGSQNALSLGCPGNFDISYRKV